MSKVVRVILRIIPYLFACASATVGYKLGIALQNSISGCQRYTTYLEAQRMVLQCRADHSIAAIDRVCGPIPTLESIK